MAKDKCSTSANRFRFRAWNPLDKRMVWPFMLEDAHGMLDTDGGPSPMILMQSTGSNDMDGNEVFEGDIIRSENGDVTTAEWDANDLCWGNSKFCMRPHFAAWTVIGNIYEHPKLAQ